MKLLIGLTNTDWEGIIFLKALTSDIDFFFVRLNKVQGRYGPQKSSETIF
jgi:hypothetical protein